MADKQCTLCDGHGLLDGCVECGENSLLLNGLCERADGFFRNDETSPCALGVAYTLADFVGRCPPRKLVGDCFGL